MAPPSSLKPKSISQLRKVATSRREEQDEVINISSDEDESSEGGADQYGPPRPPPPPPPRARPPHAPPQNAVASSSTSIQYSIPPMKKMFERPKPKVKPKQQQPKPPPRPQPSSASASSSKPKRPPPPAPAPPSPIASSSSSAASSSSESDDDDSDSDEMEEIQLPNVTALAAARAGDEEDHPALVLQRLEEEEARAARGEAQGEEGGKIFKDGKGGNKPVPAIQIQVGGEEDGGGGGKGGKDGKKKGGKKSLYTPQDRLAHLTAHMIHTVSLLANAGHRNRLLNGELLKARLLSLLPPRIPKSFTSIHPRSEPDTAKRARLFDKALASFVDWFASEFETDYHLGLRGRSWDHAFELPNPFPASSSSKGKGTGKESVVDRKGKGKAKQNDEEVEGLDIWGGELIRTEKSLQKRALVMRGSRDVGAQLFVAAARSLGLGVRLVVSLQSVGWRMGDGVKATKSEPKPPVDDDAKDGGGKDGEEETERDPNKPVRWIDRKEGERFPGLGNRMGVEVGGGEKKGKEKEREIPAALMVKTRKKGKKLGRKAKLGEKVENVDDPFDPLSAPIFWAEVFSRPDQEWIPVDPIRGFIRRTKEFEPVGEGLRNRMVYVVAFEEDGSAKDLTRKYHSNFHAKVPKVRVGLKLKVGDKGGVDWWGDMMRSMGRGYELQRDITENAVLEKKVKKLGMPTTLAGFKNHPDYVLERDLKAAEVIYPKIQYSLFRGEPVYPRSNVVECKSEETWMRQGREVLRGEEPMKLGKMRAVTINKKREIEASKERGDEMKQELYSLEQTRLYQAPAIKNGKILRNGYGNIDLFTPTMLPPGAVHLPYKGIAKIAKNLEISYAEAVTGFEYKKQRAIPIATGVVVAEENRDILMDAYEAATADAEEREQAKRKVRVIKRWQKLITDLRIRKKLQVEYGKAAAADESFQAPGGFDQDESGVQQHQFPKAKHITIRMPSEQNSRRFEGPVDQDQPMANEQQKPDSWVPRPVEEDRGRVSSDEEEQQAEDEPQQPVASSSKIILSPGKKLVPKSFEEMLAQQAVEQDSDLSSTIGEEEEEEKEETTSPKRPSRSRSAKDPPLQAPTSASKPYTPIPRITLRRSAPSSPAPAASSSRPTRASARPKPTPRLAASATPQGRPTTRAGGLRVAPSTGSSRKRGRRDDSDEESDSDEVTEDFNGGRRAAVSATPAAGGRSLRLRVKKSAEEIKKDEQRERREKEAMQEVIELSD